MAVPLFTAPKEHILMKWQRVEEGREADHPASDGSIPPGGTWLATIVSVKTEERMFKGAPKQMHRVRTVWISDNGLKLKDYLEGFWSTDKFKLEADKVAPITKKGYGWLVAALGAGYLLMSK